MKTPLFVGVDPDIHNCAFALIDDFPRIVGVWISRVAKDIRERKALIPMAVSMRDLFQGPTWPEELHKQVATAAIEAQEVSYSSREGVPPQDLLYVAGAANQAIAFGVCLWPCPMLHPTPQQWKGSVPKQIHQARVYKSVGLDYTRAGNLKNPSKGYCVPVLAYDFIKPVKMLKTDWMDVGDAIGLALYAREKYRYGEAILKARQT